MAVRSDVSAFCKKIHRGGNLLMTFFRIWRVGGANAHPSGVLVAVAGVAGPGNFTAGKVGRRIWRLILNPCPERGSPFWVSLSLLFAAMTSRSAWTLAKLCRCRLGGSVRISRE